MLTTLFIYFCFESAIRETYSFIELFCLFIFIFNGIQEDHYFNFCIVEKSIKVCGKMIIFENKIDQYQKYVVKLNRKKKVMRELIREKIK